MFKTIKNWLSKPRHEDKQKKKHLIDKCPDCGAANGKLHDLFCLKERCPFCGGQLASCDCIRTVLKLTEEEVRVLEEYADDTIPPLSEIMKRWRHALDQKGRVLFKSFSDDPYRAANRGDVAAVQRFLDDGLPINAANEVGYTILMAAARGGSLEMIRFLLLKGAQPAQADTRGYTALHWVVAQPPSDWTKQLECLKAILDVGADPNVSSPDGITPLMNAAWFGCVEEVQELLHRGADPLKRDTEGRTAKDNAAKRGHKVIEDLLK